MNKFLRNMGMSKSWAITDVFGLDEELLAMLPQPVVGCIDDLALDERRYDTLWIPSGIITRVPVTDELEGMSSSEALKSN
jgi:hypothetical protein